MFANNQTDSFRKWDVKLEAMDRTILHCDNDAFYSTTEEMLNPKLRGKAHAVAGSVEDRNGIILAKSYVAKKFGVELNREVRIIGEKL